MTLLPVLMLAILETEERSFMEEIYKDYFRLMFATAWNFTREKATVDDIVSESCIALMKNIATIRQLNGNQLKGYIVSTVRNTALDSVYRRLSQDSAPDSDATNLHSSKKRCRVFRIAGSNSPPAF